MSLSPVYQLSKYGTEVIVSVYLPIFVLNPIEITGKKTALATVCGVMHLSLHILCKMLKSPYLHRRMFNGVQQGMQREVLDRAANRQFEQMFW